MVAAAERLLRFFTTGYKILVYSQHLPPLSIRQTGIIHIPILEIMFLFHKIASLLQSERAAPENLTHRGELFTNTQILPGQELSAYLYYT
jgi:hypothetical protein